MRIATCFVLAAALVATPALAQNDAATNETVEADATMTMPADNGAMAANEVTPVPMTTDMAVEAEPAPAPAPRRTDRGFPWGVIGLVGLVGLMGRKRRD